MCTHYRFRRRHTNNEYCSFPLPELIRILGYSDTRILEHTHTSVVYGRVSRDGCRQESWYSVHCIPCSPTLHQLTKQTDSKEATTFYHKRQLYCMTSSEEDLHTCRSGVQDAGPACFSWCFSLYESDNKYNQPNRALHEHWRRSISTVGGESRPTTSSSARRGREARRDDRPINFHMEERWKKNME